MTIWSDATQEKSYASLIPYLLLIYGTPVVNKEDGFLLYLFQLAFGVPVPQGKINFTVGKHFRKMAASSQWNLVGVDQQGIFRIQTESLYIIRLHIVVKAIVQPATADQISSSIAIVVAAPC